MTIEVTTVSTASVRAMSAAIAVAQPHNPSPPALSITAA